MAHRPDDLINVQEAAVMVDRSVSSLRGWVRSNSLAGHREDEDKPNSRLMISRGELLTYVAASQKVATPGRKAEAQADGEAHRVELLTAELEAERAKVEASRSTLAAVEGQASVLERLISTERERAEEWKLRADEWKDRAEALAAENRELRTQAGLSWWKRMLTTSAHSETAESK
jgi:hypothetical protein